MPMFPYVPFTQDSCFSILPYALPFHTPAHTRYTHAVSPAGFKSRLSLTKEPVALTGSAPIPFPSLLLCPGSKPLYCMTFIYQPYLLPIVQMCVACVVPAYVCVCVCGCVCLSVCVSELMCKVCATQRYV